MATIAELKQQREQKKQAKAAGPSPTLAALIAEAQRRGALPTPKPAWDPANVPKAVYEVGSLRGAARDLWYCKDFEVLLHSGFECGKTWGCCKKLNALLWKYPGAQWVMTRKTYASLIATAVQTFERVAGVGKPDCAIKAYGGNKPEWYDYPNGSRLWVAGFDNPQKVLSGERDGFYINQAEEFGLDEYETITGRATGRGAVMPYTQVMSDCNPGPPSHWILQRPSLTRFKAYLDDNPTLWTPAPPSVTAITEEWPDVGDRGGLGRWTEQGHRSVSVLNKLTGIRYQRYRLGNWAAAEGVVYEAFDANVHTVPAFKIPASWRRLRVIDFGFTNPFVCLWAAIDPDGRIFVYREIYITEMICSELARQIRNLSGDEKYEATICDHDAEDRATLDAEGIRSIKAWKKIKPGIDAVKNRLEIAGDSKPRLAILRNSTEMPPGVWTSPKSMPDPLLVEKKVPLCTAQEFEFYVWPKDASGKPNKEAPVDEFNHGMDCLRYLVCYVDGLAKKKIRAA